MEAEQVPEGAASRDHVRLLLFLLDAVNERHVQVLSVFLKRALFMFSMTTGQTAPQMCREVLVCISQRVCLHCMSLCYTLTGIKRNVSEQLRPFKLFLPEYAGMSSFESRSLTTSAQPPCGCETFADTVELNRHENSREGPGRSKRDRQLCV